MNPTFLESRILVFIFSHIMIARFDLHAAVPHLVNVNIDIHSVKGATNERWHRKSPFLIQQALTAEYYALCSMYITVPVVAAQWE